jgi:hypothetical protein
VLAHAVCLGTTAGRDDSFSWRTGDPSLVEIPNSAGKACFLSSITGQYGTWNNSNHSMRLFRFGGGDWLLSASSPPNPFGAYTTVKVVCFNPPANLSLATGSLVPGLGNHVLYDSNASVFCGLTGISGAIFSNDWDDGVLLNWPPTIPGWWTSFITDSAKSGSWGCLRRPP